LTAAARGSIRLARRHRGDGDMTALGLGQLGASTVIFLLAASAAKGWALQPTYWRLGLVILLYTAGNLIMLRLIRDFGMGVALSLSAVIQLVAVNIVAFAWFGERVGMIEGLGILVAIVAVALITLGPYLAAR
jgi:drug/metabolite transporter (DMT)-like permease